MKSSIWIFIGCLSAFMAVAMGAFGAHALSGRLSERSLAIYQTAAQYQMYHALALIAFGLWSRQVPPSFPLPGLAFAMGTVLFSGSLYALALSGIKVFGAITPLGGLAFLVGWVAFAVNSHCR